MRDPADWRLPHHNTPTPVAGVVMLVAVAVLVGSLTIVYFLEFGAGSTAVAPIVTADFDFDAAATGTDDFGHERGSSDGLLRVTVGAGEPTDAERLRITGASSLNGPRTWADSTRYDAGGRVGAGDTVSVWVSRDDQISIVWVSADGERSALVDSWTGRSS